MAASRESAGYGLVADPQFPGADRHQTGTEPWLPIPTPVAGQRPDRLLPASQRHRVDRGDDTPVAQLRLAELHIPDPQRFPLVLGERLATVDDHIRAKAQHAQRIPAPDGVGVADVI